MTFVLIFLLLFIVSIIALIDLSGSNEKAYVLFFLALLFILLCATRKIGFDRDSEMYEFMFNNYDTIIVEPTFFIISSIIHNYFNSNISYLFFLFAVFGVSIKFYSIFNLTELFFLSLLMYLSTFYLIQEFTTIRAGIASGLLLFSVNEIYNKNIYKFLFITLLACLFHYSAIIIFPLFFINSRLNKTLLAIVIPLGYVFYFLKLNIFGVVPIPGIQEKLIIYQNLTESDSDFSKINVFSFLFLFKIFIFYFLLWNADLIMGKNVYFVILLKIYLLSLFLFLFFSTMPVFSFRVIDLLGIVEIILIPFIYYIFYPKYLSKILIIGVGFIFFLINILYVKLF